MIIQILPKYCNAILLKIPALILWNEDFACFKGKDYL